MNSREAILNRIRSAVKTSSDMKADNPYAGEKIKEAIKLITPKEQIGLVNQFQNELEAIAGNFHIVKNIKEVSDIILKFLKNNEFKKIGISGEEICKTASTFIKNSLPEVKIILSNELQIEERIKELAVTEVSIVHPSFAIADIGSLVFLYDDTGTTLPHFLCDNTFAIIYKKQIIANQFELFEKIDSEKSKNMVFVAGPSRTADIEKVLVLGAHGPRKLTVIVIDEEQSLIK
ncbi:MAG: hypothetical protein A2068_13675 [Ignavibacteria bacterium GWB2_35_6b]|nr:MAG: hypothetical protein A2068_13675 [Ignavibacteria bacterium GWB2_35_6b]